jgi:hypothetical protein
MIKYTVNMMQKFGTQHPQLTMKLKESNNPIPHWNYWIYFQHSFSSSIFS